MPHPLRACECTDTLGHRLAGGEVWGLPERYRTCRRNPELKERVVCVGDEEVAFADDIHSDQRVADLEVESRNEDVWDGGSVRQRQIDQVDRHFDPAAGRVAKRRVRGDEPEYPRDLEVDGRHVRAGIPYGFANGRPVRNARNRGGHREGRADLEGDAVEPFREKRGRVGRRASFLPQSGFTNAPLVDNSAFLTKF